MGAACSTVVEEPVRYHGKHRLTDFAELSRKRAPSMSHEPGAAMLPPPKGPRSGLTVVLDLDETLVFAREGPLRSRPHLDKLLAFLAVHCEAIVWTAASRAYAQTVIRHIDPKGVISHCIYRTPKWFSGKAGYAKDLSLIGRELDHTLMIENTPDCTRGHESHSILVTEYTGSDDQRGDTELLDLIELLEDMVGSGLKVPEHLKKSTKVERRTIASDVGDTLSVYCIRGYVDRRGANRDLARNGGAPAPAVPPAASTPSALPADVAQSTPGSSGERAKSMFVEEILLPS